MPEIPHIKLPPPLINPVEHPWMAKVANRTTMLVGRVVVPAVALPVAAALEPDSDSPWVSNLLLSAAAGAAIGGAAGLFFPEMELQELRRMDAIRRGVVSGAFAAPAVSLAIMGTAKYFFKDLLPYTGHSLPDTPAGAG